VELELPKPLFAKGTVPLSVLSGRAVLRSFAFNPFGSNLRFGFKLSRYARRPVTSDNC
jgi:hypothetical protein